MDGSINSSILSPGVVIEKGAVVVQSIIMHDTVIQTGARLYGVICDKNVTVSKHAIIGDTALGMIDNTDIRHNINNYTQTTIGRFPSGARPRRTTEPLKCLMGGGQFDIYVDVLDSNSLFQAQRSGAYLDDTALDRNLLRLSILQPQLTQRCQTTGTGEPGYTLPSQSEECTVGDHYHY